MAVWSVDRITEGTAILEGPSREQRQVAVELLPDGTREGDCLCEEGEGYVFDIEKTAYRRKKNIDLFRKLTKKNKNSQ